MDVSPRDSLAKASSISRSRRDGGARRIRGSHCGCFSSHDNVSDGKLTVERSPDSSLSMSMIELVNPACHTTSASSVCPVRGSWRLGPIAYDCSLVFQRKKL